MGVNIKSYKAPGEAIRKPKDICFNWWTWRPMVNLIRILNSTYEFGLTEEHITTMHYNDGRGIDDPETCKKLAKHIRDVVLFMKFKEYKLLYYNMGPISEDGYNSNVTLKNTQRDRFNKKYPGIFYDRALFEGEHYVSMYCCTIDDLEAFAIFLEKCYGFQVH